MMRCAKVQKMISAWADGELSQHGVDFVERHLGACECCRDFAEDLAVVAGRLDQVEAAEPRWGFTDRVLARLPADAADYAVFGGSLDLFRPAPIGLSLAAFLLGVCVTVLASDANAETATNGDNGSTVIEDVAGDYEAVFEEASVNQQLWDLLTESEDQE